MIKIAMSCSQDSFYTKREFYGTCGECNAANTCGGSTKPGCCPTSHTQTGTSGCGGCNWGYNKGKVGEMYHCTPRQPGSYSGSVFNNEQKLNCCLNRNLPSNSPNGYCQTGFCQGSTNCQSFMTGYCTGANLSTAECRQYCQQNPSTCDTALRSYCGNQSYSSSLPVCGCALPKAQYPLAQMQTASGFDVPIRCDAKCNSTDAIKLGDQQEACQATICIINDVNIDVSGSVAGGVTIQQNCGETSAPANGSGDAGKMSFFKKIGVLYSRSALTDKIMVILLPILLIVLILINIPRKKKVTPE